jgi:hypothetical protein
MTNSTIPAILSSFAKSFEFEFENIYPAFNNTSLKVVHSAEGW